MKARREERRKREERRERNSLWREWRLGGKTEGGVKVILMGTHSRKARDASNKGYEAGFPRRSLSIQMGKKPRQRIKIWCLSLGDTE